MEKDLNAAYKFITLPQKCGIHGGLGFMFKSSFVQYIEKHHQISDRVGVIDLKLLSQPKDTFIRFVNVYGPTLEKSIRNPQLTEDFYHQIQKVTDETPKHWEIIILGDFSARLGMKEDVKDNDSETEEWIHTSCGKYGYGGKNENGNHLL